MSRIDKVAVFGLDCLEPSLCFDRFLADLPNLRALMARGTYGCMTSCMPPVTIPAWSCMAASKDPGTLGIYGFRDRKDRSYDGWVICASQRVREPRLWDILTQHGRDSLVIGVPETFPLTRTVRGCVITSFLTPDTRDPAIQYTSPPELRREIEELLGGPGEYMVDVRMARGQDKRELLDQIHEMTQRRFRVVQHLMRTRPWDLMFMVEIGTDRIHHGFWSFMDPAHRNYRPGHELAHAIRDYYVFVDALLGETLAMLDPERTAVWVVSDHGARVLHGGVLLNQWLLDQGDLALKAPPQPKQKFEAKDVDWLKTRAFAAPGYYGQVYLNVKGRESQGVVEADKVESYRHDLAQRIEAMTDQDGRPLGNRCYFPDRIYRACNNVPPDLIVILGELGWRASGWFQPGSLFVYDDDAAAEDANHAQEGMYLVAQPGVPGRGRVDGVTLYDVAPTILTQLGLPVPADMQGHILPDIRG